MLKDFLKRCNAVFKYIPSGAWKMMFTMHLVMLVPVANGFNELGGYPAGKAIFMAAIWYAIIVWPIVFYIYWRRHHGKGNN